MADQMSLKITKRAVDLLTPAASETRHWDAEVKGFCVRVYPSGRKVYSLKYRTAEGRQRWYTIGQHGSPWTPEMAREKAKSLLWSVAQGHDPQANRVATRDDLTVAELIDLYLSDGPASKPDKRAASWVLDRSNLDRHVRPLIGRKMAKAVSRDDCARMVTDIIAGRTATDVRTKARGRAIVTGGVGAAARCLGTASAMFRWAHERGLLHAVPTEGVRTPRQPSPERFLSSTEARRLLATIASMQAEGRLGAQHADSIRLIMMTGARKGEVTKLRWSEVDLERRRLVLPPARTKTGGRTGERRMMLSPPAAALLSARARDGQFVFPSSKDATKPAAALQKVWDRVRSEAGLPGLRVHDLRHSYASLALARGASLALIGKALGHSSARVTERYAHLSDDPLEGLAATVAEDLGLDLTGGTPKRQSETL